MVMVIQKFYSSEFDNSIQTVMVNGRAK